MYDYTTYNKASAASMNALERAAQAANAESRSSWAAVAKAAALLAQAAAVER